VTEPEPPSESAHVLQPDLLLHLKTVVAAMATASIEHCLIGAVALGAWGRPRATQDLDFLILAEAQAREELLSHLSSTGIVINEQWQDANPTAKGRVTRFFSRTAPKYPLDVIYVSDPQEREAVNRKRLASVHGLSLWVVSPEDLMLLKLKAGRPIDFDDVMGVVKNPHLQLDLAYLWGWADRLGIHGELHYVLQAATPRTQKP
jgi:hypothetical protein